MPHFPTTHPNEAQPIPGTNELAIFSASFFATFFPKRLATLLIIASDAFFQACDRSNFSIWRLYNALAVFFTPIMPY